MSLYIFACAVHLLVLYVWAQIGVWSRLVPDNFGLFTEIAVRKFSRGLAAAWCGSLFSFLFTHFSASLCTAHCAVDLARGHAP